jgi:hypothetical protein
MTENPDELNSYAVLVHYMQPVEGTFAIRAKDAEHAAELVGTLLEKRIDGKVLTVERLPDEDDDAQLELPLPLPPSTKQVN